MIVVIQVLLRLIGPLFVEMDGRGFAEEH